MKAPMPELMVTDMQASIEFYQKALGFELTFSIPDPDGNIVHASLQNGDSMIMLSPCTDRLKTTGGPLGKGVTLYFPLHENEDVDALFTRAEAAGANVLQTPVDEFWGDRIWSVADPDGYQITIAKQVREVSMDEMQKAVEAMSVAAPA